MLEYAANDVLYLLQVFKIMKDNLENKLNNLLSIQNINDECLKYLEYSKMNLSINNNNNLDMNTLVEGLIK